MTTNPFFKKTKENKLSALIQVAIFLLYLAILVLALSHWEFPKTWRWILFGMATALVVVQCCRLKYPSLLLDRIFSDYSIKQLVMVFFIFLISLDFALCLFPKVSVRLTFIDFISPRILYEEATKGTTRFETDPTRFRPNIEEVSVFQDPPQKRSKKEYLKHGFIYLLGIIVFNGLLIATINRSMTIRAERYKNGTNTYKRIRDHYVIIGYGLSCASIIRNICRRGKMDSTTRFLLLSNQDPEVIRRQIQSQLNKVEERIVIYSGDMNSFSHLSRLNIGKAKEVFILGESREPGRDSKNLECAKLIKEFRRKGRQANMLHVNVQFDKPMSYSTIKRITIPKSYYKDDKGDEVTYLRPFNFYENWSRLLWGYHQLDGYKTLDRGQIVEYHQGNGFALTQKHVHLVIAGFNEMGTALLLEALRVCHYPNYNENTMANRTHITIVDPKMNELLPRFKSQYPFLGQIKDIEIEFEDCRIEDEKSRQMLENLSSQKDTLLTIAVCFHDPDNSLSAALTLPDRVYYDIVDGKVVPNTDTQILVRQEIKSGLADVLNDENGKYANMKVFGTLDKGMDDSLLDDKMAIIISAYYHFKYDLSSPKDFFELSKENPKDTFKEAAKNWIALSEDKRFANRYQTEIYKTYQTYRPLLEQCPELLYQTEHLRWCAERSITGYRDTHEPNIKNETYQLHKLIVPYYDLSETEKGKDKDVLEIMDKVIALSKEIDEEII